MSIHLYKHNEDAYRAVETMLEDKQMAAVIPPKWLDVDTDNFTAKMIMLPERADVDFPFEEQLIIELYSK